MNHFAVHLKLTQHGKSTILQLKKKRERDELSSLEKTWRNLKFISLSERSQSEKATYYMIPPT